MAAWVSPPSGWLPSHSCLLPRLFRCDTMCDPGGGRAGGKKRARTAPFRPHAAWEPEHRKEIVIKQDRAQNEFN